MVCVAGMDMFVAYFAADDRSLRVYACRHFVPPFSDNFQIAIIEAIIQCYEIQAVDLGNIVFYIKSVWLAGVGDLQCSDLGKVSSGRQYFWIYGGSKHTDSCCFIYF